MVRDGMVTGTAIVRDLMFVFGLLTESSGSSGKMLLRHMLDHPSSEAPSELAGPLGLLANRGEDFLERLCTQVIAEMPEEADAMRRGVPNVINKLLGQVMKSSKGTADPQSIRKMLQKLLFPS